MKRHEVMAHLVTVSLYSHVSEPIETLYEGFLDAFGSTVEMVHTGRLLTLDHCVVYPVQISMDTDIDKARASRIAKFFAEQIRFNGATAFAAKCYPLVLEGGKRFMIQCCWSVL